MGSPRAVQQNYPGLFLFWVDDKIEKTTKIFILWKQ